MHVNRKFKKKYFNKSNVCFKRIIFFELFAQQKEKSKIMSYTQTCQ